MTENIFLWTKNWLSKQQVSFEFFEQAKSSNDLAKEKAFSSSVHSVFLVNHQTEGRGQKESKWEDSDLMISFLWKDHLKKIKNSSSEDFANDLKSALKTVWTELPLKLKAPNDLCLNGKKTAGILLEVLNQGSQTALVVGLGLNVFSYPKHLPADCLTSYTKNINSKNWEMFLNHLFSLWNQRAIK